MNDLMDQINDKAYATLAWHKPKELFLEQVQVTLYSGGNLIH